MNHYYRVANASNCTNSLVKLGKKNDDPGHPNNVPTNILDVKPNAITKLRYLRLRNKIQHTTGLKYYTDDGITEINKPNT